MKISYLESCNIFFSPIDEIIEALDNNEGINDLSYSELKKVVESNEELKFYVENFDEYVVFGGVE